MVTNELRGERVDVVPFSDDPVELIQNALAPARVRDVILDDATGTATVVVSDYQLSLAIGKEGQNARLAARLTGWRIDIKSETQLEEEAAGYGGQEWAEGEWVENASGEMEWKPAEGGEAISAEEWSHAAEEQSDGPEAAPAEGATAGASADGSATAAAATAAGATDGTATGAASTEGAAAEGASVDAVPGDAAPEGVPAEAGGSDAAPATPGGAG
jgi:N utilization substance protein A